MDLTKDYPRSVHDRLAGIVQLGRTLDKARAFNGGTLGEYHYDCPMDRALFQFLGANAEEFAQAARLDDAAFERRIRERFLAQKSPGQIADWNRSWSTHGPEPGSQSERYFNEVRNRLAADRTDISAWSDLLDLEEGRPVPLRRKAA